MIRIVVFYQKFTCFNEKMSNQTQHKYDNFARFVSKCKEFVKTIENYNGSDPLEPWYDYLLWLDENFVMNSKTETIFDEILAACLCRFEQEQNYKQDRRLIKLFIKFVSKIFRLQSSNGFDLHSPMTFVLTNQ